jgi:hypothetical protein
MWNKLLIFLRLRKKPKTATEKLRDILSSQITGKLDLIWGPEIYLDPVAISKKDKDLLDKRISVLASTTEEEQDEGS